MQNGTAGVRVRLIGLGTGLWAIGVVSIHWATPAGVFALPWAWLTLSAGLAMAWGTVRLATRLAGAGVSSFEAVSLMALPASILDGVALTWTPWVYAAAAADQRAVAAWLLWFVGTSLAIALANTARRRAAT